MNEIFRYCIISLIFLFSLTSCLRTIYGIKNHKEPSRSQVNKYAMKWGVDTTINYLTLDSMQYINLLTNSPVDSLTLSFLKQPLQWQFYDSSGNLNCFVPNCNVGGFPNLKWNRAQFISEYPPTNSHCITEVSINLNELLESCKEPHGLLSFGKTNVVVYWSVFMGRQSKVMIKKLKEYLDKYPQEDRKIIYVNIDDLIL